MKPTQARIARVVGRGEEDLLFGLEHLGSEPVRVATTRECGGCSRSPASPSRSEPAVPRAGPKSECSSLTYGSRSGAFGTISPIAAPSTSNIFPVTHAEAGDAR